MREWEEAELYCRANGMELASIHSQEELDLLVGLAPNGGLHLGLDDRNNDKVWTWVDGTEVDYTNW